MSQTAEACSCIPPTLELERARASFIFEGTVSASPIEARIDGHAVRTYKFDVIRYWKGDAGNAVTLTSSAEPGGCGREFLTGGRYIVFAEANAPLGEMTDTVCSLTASVETSSSTIHSLGSGKAPGSGRESGSCTYAPTHSPGGIPMSLWALAIIFWRRSIKLFPIEP